MSAGHVGQLGQAGEGGAALEVDEDEAAPARAGGVTARASTSVRRASLLPDPVAPIIRPCGPDTAEGRLLEVELDGCALDRRPRTGPRSAARPAAGHPVGGDVERRRVVDAEQVGQVDRGRGGIDAAGRLRLVADDDQRRQRPGECIGGGVGQARRARSWCRVAAIERRAHVLEGDDGAAAAVPDSRSAPTWSPMVRSRSTTAAPGTAWSSGASTCGSQPSHDHPESARSRSKSPSMRRSAGAWKVTTSRPRTRTSARPTSPSSPMTTTSPTLAKVDRHRHARHPFVALQHVAAGGDEHGVENGQRVRIRPRLGAAWRAAASPSPVAPRGSRGRGASAPTPGPACGPRRRGRTAEDGAAPAMPVGRRPSGSRQWRPPRGSRGRSCVGGPAGGTATGARRWPSRPRRRCRRRRTGRRRGS